MLTGIEKRVYPLIVDLHYGESIRLRMAMYKHTVLLGGTGPIMDEMGQFTYEILSIPAGNLFSKFHSISKKTMRA